MILADHRNTASRKARSRSTEVIVSASRRVQRWRPTNTDANNGISKTLTIASTIQLGLSVRFSDSTLTRIPIKRTAIKKDYRGTLPAVLTNILNFCFDGFYHTVLTSLFQPNLSSTQYSVVQEHCTGTFVMQRISLTKPCLSSNAQYTPGTVMA